MIDGVYSIRICMTVAHLHASELCIGRFLAPHVSSARWRMYRKLGDGDVYVCSLLVRGRKEVQKWLSARRRCITRIGEINRQAWLRRVMSGSMRNGYGRGIDVAPIRTIHDAATRFKKSV